MEPGAVGIGLAASVLSQGADVSIFARGETAKAIKNNGIKRAGLFTLPLHNDDSKVYEKYEDIPKTTV